jgi:two-component sensor histidine kinase
MMPPARPAHRSPNQRGGAVAPKIETTLETNTLRFQCPNTGREVDSGIPTYRGTRLISIRVRCPICDNLHEWQVADGRLGTVLLADHNSNGARSTRAQSTLQDFQYPSPEITELREQLLDEFNHRLKNSLQILYSFLQSAHRKTNNTEARQVLSDTSRRIGAMGTAQQIFYSVRNSTDVSGQRFLEAVCANARDFFGEEVSINCEAAAGSLPKETAVPLALALNELLTNAAKYGANERGRVTINVGLSQRPGEIELYVQDRGSGFNFEEAQGRSSGLGLVTMLAQRLNGTFTVERRSGARCILRFRDQ